MEEYQYSLNNGFTWIRKNHEDVYLQLCDAIKEAAEKLKKSGTRFDYECRSALPTEAWKTPLQPHSLPRWSIDAYHIDSGIGVEFQGPSVKERCYYHDFTKLCSAYKYRDINAGVVVVAKGKTNSLTRIKEDFEGVKGFLKKGFESTGIPLCVLDFDALAKINDPKKS